MRAGLIVGFSNKLNYRYPFVKFIKLEGPSCLSNSDY